MSLFDQTDKMQARSTFEIATEKKQTSGFGICCGIALIFGITGLVGFWQLDNGGGNRQQRDRDVDSSSLVTPFNNG